MGNSISDLLTIREAALKLGVSKQRVHQLINEGKMPAVWLGSMRYVLRQSIQKRVEEQGRWEFDQ